LRGWRDERVEGRVSNNVEGQENRGELGRQDGELGRQDGGEVGRQGGEGRVPVWTVERGKR